MNISHSLHWKKDTVVGFIGLLKELKESYMILDMMQVSLECRGHGVGKQLFEIGKDVARKGGSSSQGYGMQYGKESNQGNS